MKIVKSVTTLPLIESGALTALTLIIIESGALTALTLVIIESGALTALTLVIIESDAFSYFNSDHFFCTIFLNSSFLKAFSLIPSYSLTIFPFHK